MEHTQLAAIGIMLVILSETLPINAAGDGIPFVTVEAHAVLRENSQLAYINVLNGSEENLDLFIMWSPSTRGRE